MLGRPRVHFSYQRGETHSLAFANWVLGKRRTVSHRLHVQAKRLMAKRTEFFLADAARLRAELGMNPGRSLAEVQGVEARFNAARRLDSRLAKKWRSSSLLAALKCIHGYEGAWDAVSHSTPTYYGGLQMDATFQQQYGPEFRARWGTADNWPIWAQLVAAVRAYRGWDGPDPRTHKARGFGPWPNTAADCGL